MPSFKRQVTLNRISKCMAQWRWNLASGKAISTYCYRLYTVNKCTPTLSRFNTGCVTYQLQCFQRLIVLLLEEELGCFWHLYWANLPCKKKIAQIIFQKILCKRTSAWSLYEKKTFIWFRQAKITEIGKFTKMLYNLLL